MGLMATSWWMGYRITKNEKIDSMTMHIKGAQMQLTNDQLLQLLGQKEIDLYALRLQLAEYQRQIRELTDKNVKLRNEEENGE
jgi:hypothetical protein